MDPRNRKPKNDIPLKAPFRLGGIKNKYLILEFFSYDDYIEILIPYICRICKSYRELMIKNFQGVKKILVEEKCKVSVTNHNQIKNLPFYKGKLVNIDYPFKVENEDSEKFLMYLAENARLGSMKFKLNLENVTNGSTFRSFLKYMKHLGTCRDLIIEEYDGSYLDTLIEHIPQHISNVHIKFGITFFFFRDC
jgi:hypothetical protein